MDTSEEYVEMCEKAIELQDINNKSFKMSDTWAKDGNTWLPRQDQLQVMVYERGYNNYFYHHRHFTNFMNKDKNFLKFLTYEQLWLAFVMYKKYHKIWNGIDWRGKGER